MFDGDDAPGEDQAKHLSKELADWAFVRSENEQADTPFAEEAQRAGHHYTGGKPDDITVVVSLIVQPKSKL